MAAASAEPRETPAIDPATWAEMKAEQAAQVDAERQARAEASARLTPVTDAEIARYGASAQSPRRKPEPEAADSGQDRAAALAEIRARGRRAQRQGGPAGPAGRRAGERRAEMTQAAIDEPFGARAPG